MVSQNPPSFPKDLDEWEARLVPQVRGVQLRLLGELEITDDERRQLGLLIGSRYRFLHKRRALNEFREKTPCAFATFLVAQGIFGYKAGNYWGEVAQTTNVPLDSIASTEWGQTFEMILQDLDKPLFVEMEGNRYVRVILAHGGIPNYSLADFFELLLHPAVTRPQYADLDTPELIEELLQRSQTGFADEPVPRFLKYGGRVAENFFERCCAIALEFLDTGLVPEATEIGLPQRVVSAYRDWVVKQEKFERRTYRSDDLRLRKPAIVFDPWGLGVTLRLPPQQISVTMAQAKFAWHIQIGIDAPHLIPIRLRRTGFDLRTTEVVPPPRLERPTETYKIKLVVDGMDKRTWQFDGVSAERPLLLFDADDGEFLFWAKSIPARRLWLLFPRNCGLSWEGQGQAVDLPSPFGQWADFRAQEVDLTQVTRLHLLQAGQPVASFPVQSDEPQSKPSLVGGALFPVPQPTRRSPLYIGAPPAIRIPLIGKEEVEAELGVWRLIIASREATVPNVRKTLRLKDAQVSHTYIDGQQFVDVLLATPDLLGVTPRGTFDIRMRGPLGRDVELPFRVWPRLFVEPIAEMYLPDPSQGPIEVPVKVEAESSDYIECPQDEGRVVISSPPSGELIRQHTVWSNPETTLLHLTVTRRVPGSQEERIPLEIPIPRLRWLLMDKAAQTMLPEWSGKTLQASVNDLSQMRSPVLLISLPVPKDRTLELQLRLQDVGGNASQKSDWAKGQPDQQQWRFSLTEFMDTLRASHAPVLRFELECKGLSGGIATLPLLSVTQALQVEDIQLRVGRKNNQFFIRMTWRELRQRLRHRHIRLWYVWQPWRPPLEIDLPDDVQDQIDIPISLADLSGRFLVQFIIKDPWLASSVVRRAPAGINASEVELIPAQKRLESLDALIKEQPVYRFTFNLEMAHIYAMTGNLSDASRRSRWCEQHLDHATIPEVLALYKLIESFNDQPALEALSRKMFEPDQLRRLLRARANNEIDLVTFEDYLSHLRQSDSLPTDVCNRLLEVNIDAVQWAAIQRLIQVGESVGVTAVLERVKQGQLSDANALALLIVNGEFSAEQLELHSDDERAVRLLMGLTPQIGDRVSVITVGTWVRTDAGWGRIEQILDPDTGKSVERFLRTERRHHLQITLRPSHDAEPLLVQLPEETIHFLRAGPIFSCPKCYACSAHNQHDILGKHNRASHFNERELYAGTAAPAITLEPLPVLGLSEKRLRFSHRAPINQWA